MNIEREKDEHRTSNVQHRMLNKDKIKGKYLNEGSWGDPEMVKTYSAGTTRKKPELLNDILQET